MKWEEATKSTKEGFFKINTYNNKNNERKFQPLSFYVLYETLCYNVVVFGIPETTKGFILTKNYNIYIDTKTSTLHSQLSRKYSWKHNSEKEIYYVMKREALKKEVESRFILIFTLFFCKITNSYTSNSFLPYHTTITSNFHAFLMLATLLLPGTVLWSVHFFFSSQF